MTDRRIAEAAVEAPGPTLTDTLAQLRAADVSVGEFVVAGGLSSFLPLTHVAATQQSKYMPGVWTSSCTCGWVGHTHGAKGARGAAVAERYDHMEAVR